MVCWVKWQIICKVIYCCCSIKIIKTYFYLLAQIGVIAVSKKLVHLTLIVAKFPPIIFL